MVQDTFSLPDGRQLGFAFYGPMNGLPVFYFHGTPSSRLEPGMLHAYKVNPEKELKKAGVKLVAVDRPGMGLSTYNPKGTFLSFADDVAALAAHLGIARTAVLAWSGGSPYALAMAHKHPGLVQHLHILCGFTQPFTPAVVRRMSVNRWYFAAAKRSAWFLKQTLQRVKNSQPRLKIPQWLTGLPKQDYRMIGRPELLHNMGQHTLKEACRSGAAGPVHEARLYFDDYGFALSDVKQPVHYWWGTVDRSVIGLHADAAASQLPNSILFQVKGEGHISLYVKYFGVSVRQVAETLRGAG